MAEECGVDSAPDVLVEINPMWALDAEDVKIANQLFIDHRIEHIFCLKCCEKRRFWKATFFPPFLVQLKRE